MPAMRRCQFCTQPPIEEVAVLRWIDDERERLTLWLCDRHMRRIQQAGMRGWNHQGKLHKIGWW